MSSPKIFIANMKVSGIYKIVNKLNGKYYVGSSNNIDITDNNSRLRFHIRRLQKNEHPNDYLQNAWNKYGKDNFKFLIIEEVPTDKLLIVEQKYLDIAQNEQDKCYNLEFKSTGGQWREASRDKMRGENNPNFGKTYFPYSWIGKKHSTETKKKMSESKKGKPNPFKGCHHSEETKEKIRQSLRMRREKLHTSPAPTI